MICSVGAVESPTQSDPLAVAMGAGSSIANKAPTNLGGGMTTRAPFIRPLLPPVRLCPPFPLLSTAPHCHRLCSHPSSIHSAAVEGEGKQRVPRMSLSTVATTGKFETDPWSALTNEVVLQKLKDEEARVLCVEVVDEFKDLLCDAPDGPLTVVAEDAEIDDKGLQGLHTSHLTYGCRDHAQTSTTTTWTRTCMHM